MSVLLILGAGGHGRVVADSAAAQGKWDRIAFCDDRYPSMDGPEWPVIGDSTAFFRQAEDEQLERFIAIGDARTRLAAVDRLRAMGCASPTIIHPRAVVSPFARVGAGTVVIAGAVVNIGASIGPACIINTGATVDHDCALEDGVHVCPGAHLAGNVTVGQGTWIGIGSAIRQGISIGSWCMVGAGAAVVADVSDDTVVVGVPARPLTHDRDGLR